MIVKYNELDKNLAQVLKIVSDCYEDMKSHTSTSFETSRYFQLLFQDKLLKSGLIPNSENYSRLVFNKEQIELYK